MFPGLYQSGMYSYLVEQWVKAWRVVLLYGCFFELILFVYKKLQNPISPNKAMEHSFTVCSKPLSAHYPAGSLLF